MGLDGTWDFTLLDRPEDLSAAHLLDAPLEGSIEVPGSWTMQGHAEPRYTNVVMPFPGEPPGVPQDNPTGVYRRAFEVPPSWSGRRVVLAVGAATSMVFVYLDGVAIGFGTDSSLASEFDLTARIVAGETHTLALVVLQWSAGSWLEDQDQWWHAGLQRSISLFSTAEAHLATTKLVGGLASPAKRSGAATGLLDVDLGVRGPPRTEPGWTAEVSVETLDRHKGRARRLASTGRLPVPHWDSTSILAEMAGAMFTEPGRVEANLEVPVIRPWSAETPTLYRALVVLRDPSGSVIEVNALRTGFRTLEVRDRELLINGAPVILRGVNVHEHDPDRGRTVSVEHTMRDLQMIKAANLNAVRAAHYPHEEHFAELCDELGLYLIDEADVESHARQHSLCHDDRFTDAIVQRVRRMAQRDVAHPSVILWSLGNESGYGAAHDEAAAFLRRWDPSRPLHYEGPFMFDLDAQAPVSDVVCPMYTSVSEIIEWSERGEDVRRPLILCEYSHAMGNACGSLMDYDDAFEAFDGLQGGFIWEWVEHGIPLKEMTGPDGAPSWGYGGDFGDDPEEGNFVLDGLVGADRVPHPVLEEVRFLGRPVRCSVGEVGPGTARIVMANQRWFSDTSDLVGEWELTADGEVVAGAKLPVRPIAARSQRTASLAWSATATRLGAEHAITLRWRQKTRTPWALKGAVVAWDQFPVDIGGGDAPAKAGSGHHGVGSRSAHRMPPGFLQDWTPSLFRALTDNDGISQGWMRGLNGSLARWVDQLGLDACVWDQAAGHLIPGGLVPGGDVAPLAVSVLTEDLDAGWHRLAVQFDLPDALDDPPRLGLVWDLPGSMERLEWFGDGPHECYPDRRASALSGRWRSSVSDQYVGYGMPQEHGHHTAMRWVGLRGSDFGVLVVGDGTQGFSARHHSDAQLWAARHTGDLTPLGDASRTYLGVDVAQRGLGQSSLGEETREPFRIRSGRHELELLVHALSPRVDAGILYAQRPR